MGKFVSKVSERLRNVDEPALFAAPFAGAAAVAVLFSPAGQAVIENALHNSFLTNTSVYGPLTVERLMEGSEISVPRAHQFEESWEESWQDDICQLPIISLGC